MATNPLSSLLLPDDTSVITAGNGAPVATTEMFGGKNLSDVSGPNGINRPDAGDFAFVAGSTAAAGWAGTDRGAGRMGEFKDTAANKVEGARDAAVKEWREARGGAKAATEAAEKQMAKQSAKTIAEQGAKLAAKKALTLGAKQAGLRVAAMAVGAAIPGPGWLIAGGVLIGSILLDGDMRNMISGIFSSGMDANQPPAPPTTNWLPASDDNRMNDIAPADKRLTELNNGVTNIDPAAPKLWHLQESQVPGLTTMSSAVSQLNDVGKHTATTANDYINHLNSAPDSWGESFQKGRADIAQNVGQFAEKAGTPVATALSSAATASDATYQELREGNAKARQQLADSQGRFLGFVGGGSGTEGLGNNLPSIEAKVRDVQAATQAVHRAGEDWMVRPTQTTSPTQPDVAARPTPVVPTPQVPPAWRQAAPSVPVTPKAAVPETKISGATPKPSTPTPSLNTTPKPTTPESKTPQTPNLGSANPFSGGGSNPFGGGGSQQGQKPLSDIMSNLPSAPKETKPETDPFKEKSKESDIKDEKDKEEKKPEDKKDPEKKPEDKKPGDEKKPEEHKPAAEAVAPAPKPAPNGTNHPVGPSTTVEVGGKPVDFKDPKLAEMVRNVMNAEDGAPSTVRAAAERAGIEIPPAGQDIGKPADPNALKPGNVISSADGKTYIYLGEDQVLGEDKKTHPLSKVSVFDGPNDGPFALNTGTPADGQQPAAGTPAPGQGQQPQAGAPGAPAAPAAPAAGTDQAQQPGQPAAPAAPAQPSGTPAPQPSAGTPVPGQGSATFPTTPEAPIGMGAHQGGDQSGSGSGSTPAAPAPSSVNAPADPKPQSNPTVPPGASAASPAGPGSAPVDPSTITP